MHLVVDVFGALIGPKCAQLGQGVFRMLPGKAWIDRWNAYSIGRMAAGTGRHARIEIAAAIYFFTPFRQRFILSRAVFGLCWA